MQPPSAEELIISAQLKSISVALEIVCKRPRQAKRGRSGTQASQIAVIIVKGGGGDGSFCAELRAVTQFVSDERFRLKTRIAGFEHLKRRRKSAGDLQVVVEARWRADGAGNCAPKHLFGCRRPLQPDVRFNFKASIIVVFNFGSKRQIKRIKQFDFILAKEVDQALVQRGRRKNDLRASGCGAVLIHFMRETIAGSPHKLIAFTQAEVVLKFHV